VGGHLLWHLLQTNDKVVAIKRKTSNLNPLKLIFGFYTENPDAFLNRIEWRIADVNDAVSLLSAFEDIDFVYHSAAVVSLGNGSDEILQTKIQGTKSLLDICLDKKIKKLCYVSSTAACGNLSEGFVDETTPWIESEGKSMYAKSKYYSEQEVWKAIKRGLNAVMVNPGVILGFSGTDTGSSLMFAKMKKGFLFYTESGTGYVDVRDVVTAMIKLMESEVTAERFLLIGENNSNREVQTMITKGFGKISPFIKIGKPFMLLVGFTMEILGKIFKFSPIIDRSLARTAFNRTWYSNKKIIDQLGISFISSAQSVRDVCNYMIKLERKE
jgi:nucleoside-diphosphate-sugar epimerase